MINELGKTTEIVNKDFEVLVNPNDFGIETELETRVPITSILESFSAEYNEIVSAEITPNIVEKASSLRKKMVKIGTSIDKTHKDRKEYWLTGGREVDKWKNESKEIVESKKNALYLIETHFQRIEQQRILDLTADRIKTLADYGVDGNEIPTIAVMSEDVWNMYLSGVKTNFQIKKEAEAKAEKERLELKAKEDAEREKERLENVKLKAEAEQKEKELAIERAKVEAEKKEAEAKAKKILDEQKAIADAKLKKEREEKAKIEAELKAKKDAELKAKADEEARLEAEANMGDSEKVNLLIQELGNIKHKFQFKSKKNQKMFAETLVLIDKLVVFIKK